MALSQGFLLNNRYRIVRQLGQGGFGAVYQAYDTSLEVQCAVKENTSDAEFSSRQFFREATLLAQLRHPNLPRVTDYFSMPGQGQYLVMDYIEGQDLQAMLSQHPRGLPKEQVLPWIAQVCDALQYLHSQTPPVVHRDIKPANIKITSKGQAVLVDFGIAKIYQPGTSTTIGAKALTPGFSPPEQYGAGGRTDPRSDIYALGATLYMLLTGKAPVESVERIVGHNLPAPRAINPSIPQNLNDAILKALAMDPAHRFQTIAPFAQAISSFRTAPRTAGPSQTASGNTTIVEPPSSMTEVDRGRPSKPRGPYPTGTGSQYPEVLSPSIPITQPGGRLPMWAIWGCGGLSILLGLVCMGILIAAAASGRIPALAFLSGEPTQAPGITQVANNPPPEPTDTGRPTTAAEPAIDTPIPQPQDEPDITNSPTETLRPSDTATLQPSSTATSYVEPLIVYANGDVGSSDIYIAKADGSDPECIACRSCDESEPHWSPDGQSILYQSDCDGTYDIWRVDLNGGSPEALVHWTDSDEREADWSPDGRQIVFRVNSKGADRNSNGQIMTLTLSSGSSASLGFEGRAPVYSPDGRYLAYMSDVSGRWQIHLFDLRSYETSQLTDCSVNCRWPAWSPDSQYIVYNITSSDDPAVGTANGIFYISVNGGLAHEVLTEQGCGRPSWSSSGWIVFNTDAGLDIVEVDGSSRRMILQNRKAWAPDWSN